MKKIALAMVAATAVFASNAAYNYEITPTIGGVHPEGNLRVKDHTLLVLERLETLKISSLIKLSLVLITLKTKRENR